MLQPQYGESPMGATVLGLIGTICWCIQLLPQIYSNHRRKNTDGLPGSMFLLWAISGVPFSLYTILQNLNLPIQIQPQIFTFLSLIVYGQILGYTHHYPRRKALLTVSLLAGTFAAVEITLILILRQLNEDASLLAVYIIGIIAAVLLTAGLLPPYFEIWKRGGEVKGINWGFLVIDCAGAVFSLASVCVEESFDYLAFAMYAGVMVLELGIFVCGGVWAVRYWRRKKVEALRQKVEEEEVRKIEEGLVSGWGSVESSPASSPTETTRLFAWPTGVVKGVPLARVKEVR